MSRLRLISFRGRLPLPAVFFLGALIAYGSSIGAVQYSGGLFFPGGGVPVLSPGTITSNTPGPQFNADGSYSSQGTAASTGPATWVSQTGAPLPGVTCQSQQACSAGILQYSLMDVFYPIEVAGAAGNVTLGIMANGSITATNGFVSYSSQSPVGGLGNVASASIRVFDLLGNTYFQDAVNYSESGNTVATSFSDNTFFTVPTNSLILVEMDTFVQQSAGYAGTTTAYIDPIFTAPQGFTLELADGITQANNPPPPSSVPEPSSFVAMLGVGLVAATRYLGTQKKEHALRTGTASRESSGAGQR
jgi:hypothetical protein